MIVLALAALLAIGALFAFVWVPVNNKIASQHSAIASKTKTLTFLQQGDAKLKAMGPGGSVTKQSDKPPIQLINQVVGEVIGEPVGQAKDWQPQRIQPLGDDKARVTFNQVPFDKLVSVIAELELYSVQIDQATLSRQKEAGIVSARLTMVRK